MSVNSSPFSDTHPLYKWIKPLLLGHLDNMLMFKRWFSVSKIILWLTDIRARSRDPSGLKSNILLCLSRVFFKIVLNERLIPWAMKFTGSANIVNKYGLLVCMLSLRYFIVVFYTFFLNLCRIGPTKMFHPILEL